MDWSNAKCLGLWATYDQSVSAKEAKSLCEGCPVIHECLTDALDKEGTIGVAHRVGVRGGVNELGRVKLSGVGSAPCGKCGSSRVNWRCRPCESVRRREQRRARKLEQEEAA